MANRLFQGVIHQMRDTIDRTIGVVDDSGMAIACSDLVRCGELRENITAEQITGPAGAEGFTGKRLLLIDEGCDEEELGRRDVAVGAGNARNLDLRGIIEQSSGVNLRDGGRRLGVGVYGVLLEAEMEGQIVE